MTQLNALEGPLQGLPVAVKDIFDSCDLPTSYGSPLYAGAAARSDAAMVSAIRRAGGLVIAALFALEALSEADVPLSGLLRPFDRYFASGEINSEVADQEGTIEKLAVHYADGKEDRTDGLTVEYEDWWFNCRASNTEPLLRLNLEARTKDLMTSKRDEVLNLIREG